jgi:hypothetical protein
MQQLKLQRKNTKIQKTASQTRGTERRGYGTGTNRAHRLEIKEKYKKYSINEN